VIEAQGLTMHYGPVVAVEDASFTVSPKEVVGLLGPNGAGKSTIMKILTTYLWPTSGTAKVCGRDVLTEPLEVRRRVGYLPEVLPLYPEMEVADYVDFVGRARGLGAESLKKRKEWVMERCGVRDVWRRPARELSKGYRQRTALAQALVHDPEVVILDEPTSGLDPHQILEIRKLVRELAAEKTVILSTHILQEVEAVADRIVIISRGRIVADGTLTDLRRRAMKRQRIEVAASAAREELGKALGSLRDAKRVDFHDESNGIVRYRVEADHAKDILKQVYGLLKDRGWDACELRDVPFTLEETFLALTEAETANA
jgi:ABC-2 type transport system ATP-binding protein